MKFDDLKQCVVRVLGPDSTGRGTGFFVSAKGFLLTCHHVISDLPELVIEYAGRRYLAEWCPDMSFPERDIAVLRIDPTTLHKAIPEISSSDFGAVEGSGVPVDAYGFPSKKSRSFAAGFDVHGELAPGQPALILPRDSQRRAIDSLAEKAPWNFLPRDKEVSQIEVYNLESTLAQQGVSGAPVLCLKTEKIVGFINASEAGEQRAYVIKWENVRCRWPSFPQDAALPFMEARSWAVPETFEVPSFLDKIEAVRLTVEKTISETFMQDPDLAVTLYTKSFSETGVGSFEYDLLYYWNLRDPTPMFGPIVHDDERIKITEDDTRLWYVDHFPTRKSGGFVDREGTHTASWFKLGNCAWTRDGPSVDHMEPDDIQGLLFINARNPALGDLVFQNRNFLTALSELEGVLVDVISRRKRRFDKKRLRLVRAFPPSHIVRLLNRKTEIASEDVITLFNCLVPVFEEISDNSDVAFTVLAYDSVQNRLNWLWSNGPTSVKASTSLPQKVISSQHEISLPVQIALDENHKPLLVHYLQSTHRYRGRAIVTMYGARSQANLVVPILSNSEDRRLLGVVDIQGSGERDFDTDDVQLVYMLISEYVSNFLEQFLKISSEKFSSVMPLRSTGSFSPFGAKPLGFAIHQLLDLSFNPMKYLFHWDRIQEVILGKLVSFPCLVEIWPSMRCDHRCTWCRTKPDQLDCRRHPFMNREALLELAHDLVAQDRIDVLISGGGEPLLHENMHEFMKILKDIRGTLGIFTNGTRPTDFRFWQHFFSREDNHSFVRISFNGADPRSYYEIHFDHRASSNRLPRNYQEHYAEARKTTLDLLGMRPKMCTVALGSTVHSYWLDTIETQAKHAERLGVDFIQLRPELNESSKYPRKGHAVREAIQAQEKLYGGRRGFAVKYTDNERAFRNHDYDTCYAMFLVPALVPDLGGERIRVLPCSYAESRPLSETALGSMGQGAKLSDFWRELNVKMGRAPRSAGNGADVRVELETKINPIAAGCPQCRYYMLNSRIIEIKNRSNDLHLINRLVECLKQDPDRMDEDLVAEIEKTWDRRIVDVELARKAFTMSKRLGIRPSL